MTVHGPSAPRFDFAKASPDAYRAMVGLERALAQGAIEPPLRELVKVRASQMNGCAFCLDMHWKDARAAGESEQRLYGLAAWREAPWYTARERAALAWCEALTFLTDGYVTDEVYQAVRPHFSERELADLSLAIVTINAWNRLMIASRREAGTHVPTSPHGGAPGAASKGI
jgi:AhpD family alkylhydroperoxidase